MAKFISSIDLLPIRGDSEEKKLFLAKRNKFI